MYELEYVKKRKRRKAVAIAAGISAVVVTSLAIVAFLGRFVGTFTVSLKTRDVELSLSEKSAFTNRSSFLRVNNVAPFHEFTYSEFEKFGDTVIDSESSSLTLGANYIAGSTEIESLRFFKYTFFVKNVGQVPAKYDFSLNITDNVASDDGRSLDETLRVMIYDDGEKTVFAKRSAHPVIKPDGSVEDRSPISVSEADATDLYPFMGYAEKFESSKVVTTFSGETIGVDELRRYTIVTWLEGFQSDGSLPAPEGATIKLGVEINAYEN